MVDRMFYKEKGVYTAEWGYYFHEDHLRAVPLLLEESYKIYIEKGHTHHSISIGSNEAKALETMFDNGYASRCIDSIWKLDKKFKIDYKVILLRGLN